MYQAGKGAGESEIPKKVSGFPHLASGLPLTDRV
jgi:hypothetical protein